MPCASFWIRRRITEATSLDVSTCRPLPRQPPSKERTMRNTICATLTAITLTLCTALAGCGSASEPSTPAHAVRSVDSQCSAIEPRSNTSTLKNRTPPPNKQRTRPSGRDLALPQTRLPRRRESNKCTNQPTNPNQPPPTPQQTPAKQHQRSPVCASSAAEDALSETPCARDAMG